MTFDELRPYVEFVGMERMLPLRRIINAGGHFGNFELYARVKDLAPGYQCATTYRALNQPALNRLLERLRNRSGCLFFERRTDGAALRAALNQPAIMLGLPIDQHGGDKGLRLPFLGHDCSTTSSPALFALRYHCELYTALCFRVGLAQWRIEVGDQIPTHENGRPRSVEDIMRDVIRAFEAAVRRDPANWFWVHRRWKPASAGKSRRWRMEDRKWKPRHPSSILCHVASEAARRSPYPGSRNELAGRRGHDHARAAAAARKISRCAHHAAHAGKIARPVAAASKAKGTSSSGGE